MEEIVKIRTKYVQEIVINKMIVENLFHRSFRRNFTKSIMEVWLM